MSQKLGEKLKSRDNFHRHYLVLWNLMMSLESNVVTSEEAEFLYPLDMSKEEDVLTVFDAFVKEDFLSLEEEKQKQVLETIEDVIQAGDEVVEHFFEYEFGLASKEPRNKVAFLELVKDILVSYLSISD